MICSLHFNPECFKEINGKKFLKEWRCPSIFSFPDNFQKTANNPTRLTKNFSCSPEVDNREMCNTQDTVMTDHHYHITDSPKTLKRKLDELVAENHKLRRKLKHVSNQEETP